MDIVKPANNKLLTSKSNLSIADTITAVATLWQSACSPILYVIFYNLSISISASTEINDPTTGEKLEKRDNH